MSSIGAAATIGNLNPGVAEQPVQARREADRGRDEATESASQKTAEVAAEHRVHIKA